MLWKWDFKISCSEVLHQFSDICHKGILKNDSYNEFKIVLKYFFFFQRHENNLALLPAEKAALECVKAGLETWEYKAKNALMYYPEGKVLFWFIYLIEALQLTQSIWNVFCLLF